MTEADEHLKALEERVARLERQIAVLLKKKTAAPAPVRSRDYRDSYDALDYPQDR